MSAEIETAVADGPTHHAARSVSPTQAFRLAVAVIVTAQAVWLAILMSRGWYYQADFSNLADATGHPLSLSYLMSPTGGHVAVPGRLFFWLVNRVAPLSYGLTILLRLAVQAVTTVLLARLLVLLVGRRPGVLVVIGLYAFTPMLVQSQLWFTAATGFLPSQLLILIALRLHIRYWADRRIVTAAYTSAAVLGAALLSDQAAVAVLMFPLLSVGFLFEGPWRERVRATVDCWPEWVAIAAPLMIFVTFFLGSGTYTAGQSTGVSVSNALTVLYREFDLSVLPGMFGGPLGWIHSQANYLSIAAPPGWLRLCAIGLTAWLVYVTIRRTGLRALVAWAMPVVVIGVGILIVAIGRFNSLGTLVARQFEHTGYVVIPLAVAVCLAFYDTSPAAIRQRLDDGPGEVIVESTSSYPRARWGAVALLVVVAAASVSSTLTYAGWWSKNPAHAYVRTLDAHLRVAGPNVAVYDTPVNGDIIPGIEPRHYVSDLVGLMQVPARFNTTGSGQVMVAADGSLQPAVLFVVAKGLQAPSPSCAALVKGVGTWTVPLSRQPKPGEYYLTMSYLQANASVIDLTVTDSGGHSVAPVHGQRTELPPGSECSPPGSRSPSRTRS